MTYYCWVKFDNENPVRYEIKDIQHFFDSLMKRMYSGRRFEWIIME